MSKQTTAPVSAAWRRGCAHLPAVPPRACDDAKVIDLLITPAVVFAPAW